ncbi:MAG: anthranilate phosphoribosyltransferase [Bacteroidota bacterium]
MIDDLLAGRHLPEAEAQRLMHTFVNPEVPDATKAGLLVALRAKGETPDEIRGLARAMREVARELVVEDVSDTCGTGGDGKHTVNLSTAAALVVAACGFRIAKHGNRSVSSRSGSADVLEALGIPMPSSPAEAKAQLTAHGFTFLFAPSFHPAMKAVVPVRRALGVRTVFNVLGPLTNPARPGTQVVGAYDEPTAERIARALVGLVDRAVVVHGLDGYDEAVPTGPFVRFDVATGEVRRRVVDPRDLGIARCAPDALRGGEASDNAAILTRVFEGERGPVRDAIVLNAALLLELRDPTVDAVKRAEEALDTGAVMRQVEALRG